MSGVCLLRVGSEPQIGVDKIKEMPPVTCILGERFPWYIFPYEMGKPRPQRWGTSHWILAMPCKLRAVCLHQQPQSTVSYSFGSNRTGQLETFVLASQICIGPWISFCSTHSPTQKIWYSCKSKFRRSLRTIFIFRRHHIYATANSLLTVLSYSDIHIY